MTLDEARAHIGHGVLYSPPGGDSEEGVITRVDHRYAFVRYGADRGLMATRPEDLTLLADSEESDLLGESQRFQVEEARNCLGTWDLAREGTDYIDRERVLADQVRALLAVVDEIAPPGDKTDAATAGGEE